MHVINKNTFVAMQFICIFEKKNIFHVVKLSRVQANLRKAAKFENFPI